MSAAQRAEYEAGRARFAYYLLQLKSSLDFVPGSRGWCYLLEQQNVIKKGQFKAAESLINDLRKSGGLPIDFCASDEKRKPSNLEELDEADPAACAAKWAGYAADSWTFYNPVSFWEFQDCYVEMAVEKVDLRSLFERVCADFHVPIWNAGGWSDINSRAELMGRFKEHDEAGRHCVLLYCGDFDPAGLNISNFLRANLEQLSGAVGWEPDEGRLTIERFGLNKDFIISNRLSWIDGLETGSGKNLADPKHPDYELPYVQDYLREHGARKVEANALVVQPTAGRALAREAILKYVSREGILRYKERLAELRGEVRKVLPGALKRALNSKGETP